MAAKARVSPMALILARVILAPVVLAPVVLAAGGCTSLSERGSAGSTATADAAEGRGCFLASAVSGFTDASRSHVVVVAGGQSYRLDLIGSCPTLTWTEDIALRPTGGSPWICLGDTADVIVPSYVGQQTCSVTAAERLAAASLPGRRTAFSQRRGY